MTQGTRTRKKATVNDADLDLDAWISERGLTARRIKVGGEWFEFDGAAVSDKVVEVRKHINENNLGGVLKTLLSTEDDWPRLEEALGRQKAPIGAQREIEFLEAILAHLFAGKDLGESSAS